MRFLLASLLLCTLAQRAPAFSLEEASDAFSKGDYATALYHWRPLAEDGDAYAQFNIGLMYDLGQGLKENNRQAISWYRRSADQGYTSAQYNLALMYDNGEGMPEDDEQAVLWYRKAAEQDHSGAQLNLAVMYERGTGVATDMAQAISWYRKAADQGEASAQFDLGVLYDDGKGVPLDDTAAAAWYRKAAEQGHKSAQFNLAMMYDEGEGMAVDDAQAAFWYRKAALQGHLAAQYNLALMYKHGEGVPADEKQATAWLRKAADQGFAEAQASLGPSYVPDGKALIDKLADPRPASWVLDQAGALDDETREAIDSYARILDRKGMGELMVVTQLKLERADARAYAKVVYNRYGIGKAGNGRGVLLFFAIEDRRAELILGTGIDNAGNRAIAERIMQQHIVPALTKGQWGSGLLAGTREAARQLLGMGAAEALPAAR